MITKYIVYNALKEREERIQNRSKEMEKCYLEYNGVKQYLQILLYQSKHSLIGWCDAKRFSI